MCVFTHIAAGALAGSLSPSPYYAPFLGLGSHVVLDVIPHYDIDSVVAEISLAVLYVVVLIFVQVMNPAIILGMIFAILPDLENLLWKKGKISNDQKIFPGHRILFPHGKVVGKTNLYYQLTFAVAVTIFLVKWS